MMFRRLWRKHFTNFLKQWKHLLQTIYNLSIYNVDTQQNDDSVNCCMNDKPETKYHFSDSDEANTGRNLLF